MTTDDTEPTVGYSVDEQTWQMRLSGICFCLAVAGSALIAYSMRPPHRLTGADKTLVYERPTGLFSGVEALRFAAAEVEQVSERHQGSDHFARIYLTEDRIIEMRQQMATQETKHARPSAPMVDEFIRRVGLGQATEFYWFVGGQPRECLVAGALLWTLAAGTFIAGRAWLKRRSASLAALDQ